MDIEYEAKKTSTRIIDWCFLKNREGLDENLPTKIIEELLEKQKKEMINKFEEYIRKNVDPQLIIYHNNSWCNIDGFIAGMRKELE